MFWRECRHEFDYSKDMSETNIPIPEGSGYYPGSDLMLKHPAHTHRVYCMCRKCGKWFFAHCGLDLPGMLVKSEIESNQ
jgi:hypothetical protein